MDSKVLVDKQTQEWSKKKAPPHPVSRYTWKLHTPSLVLRSAGWQSQSLENPKSENCHPGAADGRDSAGA